MIAFLCSGCGKSLKVKDELAGRKGRCPHCQQPMTVPSSADAANERAAQTGHDNYSETDAKTVLPPSLDTDRDLKTILPAVPRGNTALKKGNTLVPGASGAKGPDAELYDFLSPPQEKDEIGRLGSYRVLKVLGAGGMGVVFQAEDPRLNRLVALKAMLPALAASGSNKERFIREARAAAAIEHDHIVAIFQVDEDRGVPFIAMPFLRGEALEDRLKRERKMPIAEALRIAKEAADGLAAAHERNMIHRDIKPANIWLEGEKGRVKILDFGLARSSGGDSQLTQQGAIIGTPAYMAPEQGAGKAVDTRCDLFSLGCVLYRMATGQMPFKGADTVSTLVAVATETPTAPRKLNPNVSPRLSKLIMDLLAKNPNNRPPSALSVVDLITEIEQEPPSDHTEIDDEPAARVRGVRADDHDTLYGGDEDEADGEAQPDKRSMMMPLLIGGGVGLLVLLAVAIIGIVLVVKKKDTPEVAQVENPSNVQRPPVNPNPVPVVPPGNNLPPMGGDPLRIGGERDPGRLPPPPLVKKAEPREADKTFKSYNSAIKEIHFAPDGKHFITISARNSRLDYWELATGKIVQQFDLGDAIRHCRISSDGTRVGAFSYKHALVWEIETAKPVAQATPPLGHQINGLGLIGDKDVRVVLTAPTRQVDAIQVFDYETKKIISVVACPRTVYHVWISPDGKQALSWGSDRILRTWNLETHQLVTSFPVAPNRDKGIAVSADFQRVMGTFHQANVHLYDMAAGTELKDIKVQDFGDIDAVAFGSENNIGVAGGFTGIVRVLDFDEGKIKKELKAGSIVTAVALSPDGKTVISGDFTGKLYIHKLED